MGYVQSWIAVKSENISDLLGHLKLHPNGARWPSADGNYSYADMCCGWHVVVCNDRRRPFFSETPEKLSKISTISDLIVGAVEEHVNYSVCEFWREGKKLWKVDYTGHEESPELVTEGVLPDCFSKIKEECEALQAADKQTDYLIEIPLRVCEQLCGYVHDRDIEGIGDDPFEELDSVEGGTKLDSPKKQGDGKKSWFNWFQKD